MSRQRDLLLREIKDALMARGRTSAESEQMIQRLIRCLGEGSRGESDSDSLGSTIMYFGKYRGEPLSSVPLDYLGWLLSQPWFSSSHAILAEKVREWMRAN